jgi:hypothetical protein
MTSNFYKKINRVVTTALMLLVISVFLVNNTEAQGVGILPDVVITANVIGCGDGIVQTSLGEQCDGLDLNAQTCSSIGFTSGVIACRNSCIFDTNSCVSGTSPRRVRDVSNVFNNKVLETNIVFMGQGEPGSTFFVMTDAGYFTSTPVDARGNFLLTVSEVGSGNYDFTFYTISPFGLFGPEEFSIPIQKYATTYINNIFISYAVEAEIIELELALIVEPEFNQDIDTLKDLGINENMSPDDLQELINNFSEQNRDAANVLTYSTHPWTYTQTWLSQKSNGLTEWYPNTYISYMVPYWNLVYDLTDWFKAEFAPFNLHSVYN